MGDDAAQPELPDKLDIRDARRLAVQVLFTWDANDAAETEVAEAVTRPTVDEPHTHATRRRAREMADGAWGQRAAIDEDLERIAPQWPPRRQPAADRAILRLAAWELRASDVPPVAAIDEAIELAKTFGTADSPRFVNGVLDALLKERRALIGEL
jgi:N utilization substance protein B